MTLNYKSLSLSVFSLLAISACKLSHLNTKDTNEPRIEVVTEVVYVEKTNDVSANFCGKACSPTELSDQLNSFAAQPSPINAYQWVRSTASYHAKALNDLIKSLETSAVSDESLSLLRGIFFSVPRTGFRDTSKALKNILRFQKENSTSPKDQIFLGFLASHLQERKLLIEERSNLRKQTIKLQTEAFAQSEIAIQASNQLRKLKDIEKTMLKEQANTQQYKVSE